MGSQTFPAPRQSGPSDHTHRHRTQRQAMRSVSSISNGKRGVALLLPQEVKSATPFLIARKMTVVGVSVSVFLSRRAQLRKYDGPQDSSRADFLWHQYGEWSPIRRRQVRFLLHGPTSICDT